MNKEAWLLLANLLLAFGLVGVIAYGSLWMRWQGLLTWYEALSIIPLGALAVITTFYAVRTSFMASSAERQFQAMVQLAEAAQEQLRTTTQIADATKRQTDATQQLAEQARRQLAAACRPILRFTKGVVPDSPNLEVENIGSGPAVNVKSWVEAHLESGSTLRKNTDAQLHRFEITVLPAWS